ncbi:hypothetical protein N0V86_005291 [Didymella sp. IMI 355093]|nr:hypothetical protein N0V86_005291 [Didymella sp. IMI 355093]
MGKAKAQKPHIVDGNDRISIWLRNADQEDYEEGDSKLRDAPTVDPTTPPRRALLPTHYEEISPTNTSFSEDSIFDTPGFSGSGWYDDDVFHDDDPDAVPADDLRWCSIEKERLSYAATTPAHVDADSWEADSHASYDPPSEAADDLQKASKVQEEVSSAAAEPTLDSDKPRPTFLTSCIQCIHADLPCSRKAPACSRCKRKGQAALCLLHRRLYPEEIKKSDATWYTTLVLLKLRGEDNDMWKEKLKLANKLRDLHLGEQSHRNWTLPPVDSPRGDFRTHGTKVPKTYPSEGKGEGKHKHSYQELCVVVDD